MGPSKAACWLGGRVETGGFRLPPVGSRRPWPATLPGFPDPSTRQRTCRCTSCSAGSISWLRRTLFVIAVYHIVCWSISGRTLGGLVMRQRVAAIDGTRLTPTQALLRLALTPVSWLSRRPVHDEIAATEVIADP
ncbi:MAG: RDD family protein [Chloroflexi bacterium]|nr:MAG: RDD family protein [Chloroflexota bacterium]